MRRVRSIRMQRVCRATASASCLSGFFAEQSSLGIRQKRVFLRTCFANRARSWPQCLGLGAAVYVLGFMAIALVGAALYFTPLFHKRNEAVILALAPHTALEFLRMVLPCH